MSKLKEYSQPTVDYVSVAVNQGIAISGDIEDMYYNLEDEV